MTSRFRTELTRVPDVRIQVNKNGLQTTIDWDRLPTSKPGQKGLTGSQMNLGQIGDPRHSGPLPTDRFLIPGTRQEFGTGSVAEMTSPGLASFKSLLEATRKRQIEIAQDTSRAKWQLLGARAKQAAGWVSLASVVARPVRESTSRAVALRKNEVSVLQENMAASTISVDFDMSTEVAAPHRAMQAFFEEMAASDKTWRILTQQGIDRVRARTTSNAVVTRSISRLSRKADPLVNTSEAPLALEAMGGKAMAYFYPGFVLVISAAGRDFALIDMTELEIRAARTHFTEDGALPRDGVMHSKTWAKSNKNGTRDRRFANNRELPVMEYGEVSFSSAGGFNERYLISRLSPVLGFAAAASELKAILGRARLASRTSQQAPRPRLR